MVKISERLKQVSQSIGEACSRAGRAPSDIRMVVVTKSAAIDSILEVMKLGALDLGENRVQQFKKVSGLVAEHIAQDESLPKNINWHMIGHLQRNKVRSVLSAIHLIHSVDTLRLAEEISSAAKKQNISPSILLQVNTSNEPQKYGVPIGAATHLAEQIMTLPNLKLCGLMTMAPLTKDKDAIRSCFTRANELFVEMKGERIVGPEFKELSMGMSSDYEIAIEEGATILRIGSAIFAG